MKNKLIYLVMGITLAANIVACGQTKPAESVEPETEVVGENSTEPEDTVETEDETVEVEEVTAESIIASLEKFDNVVTESSIVSKLEKANNPGEDFYTLIDLTTTYSREYSGGVTYEKSTFGITGDEANRTTAYSYTVAADALSYINTDYYGDSITPVGRIWYIIDADINTYFDFAQYSELFKDAMLEDLDDTYLISKNFNYDDAFLADIFGFSVGMDVITDDNPLSFTFNITVNKETNKVENISAVHKSESEEYKKDSVTIVTFSKYGEVPAIEIPEEAYDGELMTMEAMIAEYGLAENTDEESTVETETVE